jgi:SAM-dependent methyltransferase
MPKPSFLQSKLIKPVLRRLFKQCARPHGFWGRLFLAKMNAGHRSLHEWALAQVKVGEAASALDIGCGGGAVVARLLKMAPKWRVFGLDLSPDSVAKTLGLNRQAAREGRLEALEGRAESLPWPDGSLDLVTAFETVYFWPDWPAAFREIARVLKPGGTLAIGNSIAPRRTDGDSGGYWVDLLQMRAPFVDDLARDLSEAGFSEVEVIRRKPSADSDVVIKALAPGGF